MAATENVFLTLVCPILGVIIGTAMYCSPCKACWNVHRTQKLGVSCRRQQLQRVLALHVLQQLVGPAMHLPCDSRASALVTDSN
jgi:hypothetical protein